MYIIWYPFYKGRLFILLFPSWISYSTISAIRGIVTAVVLKECPDGWNCPDGSRDLAFWFQHTTKYQHEPFWLATAYIPTRALGSQSYGSLLRWDTYMGSLPQSSYESYQRPALYTFDNHDKHYGSI